MRENCKMEVADVVFFRHTDNFISKAIALLTSSEFTHVGLITSVDGENKGTIIEADRFIKTRRREFEFDPSLHALYRVPNLTDRQKRDIVSFALTMEGARYDYLQVIGFFIRLVFKLNIGNLFNRSNYLICSELIDKAYYTSGVPRNSVLDIGDVLPNDLLNNYDFRLINKTPQP